MTISIGRTGNGVRGRVACNATYEGAAAFIAHDDWSNVAYYPSHAAETGLPVRLYIAAMLRGGYGGLPVEMGFASDGQVAVAAFVSPKAGEAEMRSLIGDFLRVARAQEVDAPHAVGNALAYFRNQGAR